MEDGYLIDKAEMYTRERLTSNKEKENTHYIEHCFRVASLASRDGLNPILYVIGMLHDVLENTDATYKEIISIFGPSVADCVVRLSRTNSANDEEYYKGICSDPAASIVKLFDRLDNLRNAGELKDKAKYFKDTKEVFLPYMRECSYLKIGTYKAVLEEIETLCK